MDFNFISKAFLATLGGVPVTLLIMVVSILLSFFPALFLALGQIYKVKGVRSFSVIYWGIALVISLSAQLLEKRLSVTER